MRISDWSSDVCSSDLRKSEGLLLPMSVRDNISMASIGRFTKGIFIDRKRQDARVDEMIRRLAIKVGDADSPVATLSGGNQQKVVIAKWLMTEARIVLLDRKSTRLNSSH